jgi:DNA polymerase-3 subunit delta'
MEITEVIDHLQKLYQSNKLYSSIILNSKIQETNLNVANELVRYIFCEKHIQLDQECKVCQRTTKQKNLDVIYVGDGVTAITKNEIQSLIEKMSFTASESNGNKVYILANAENLKVEAANSLLKFLEEPPAKTYAILLSNDRSKILQTIKSRCKMFVVKNEVNEFEENYFEKILDSRDKNTYLLAAHEFKKMSKKDFIMLVEISYARTVLKKFPEMAESTLLLIEDLKYVANSNLSIDNYFINIAKVV